MVGRNGEFVIWRQSWSAHVVEDRMVEELEEEMLTKTLEVILDEAADDYSQIASRSRSRM